MGSFYTNVTLRHGAVDEVVRALEAAGRSAFVSPAVNGCCVVFDAAAEEQDAAELERLVKPLSKRLRCAAWAVLIHDDDLLYYVLFESGRMTDEYSSRPDYFEGGTRPPEGGAARALAAAFDAHARAGDVERILHRGEYGSETERHAELVEALGLPEAAIGSGYDYISEGELPPGLRAEDLATAGDARVDQAEAGADAPPPVDLSPEETAALQARLSARVTPTAELAAVIGAGPFPYQMVLMKVIGYVVRNGLATTAKNEIVPDAALAKVVGEAPIPYGKLPLLLDRHLTGEGS
jgi:upstream activation factor subunit UAF30